MRTTTTALGGLLAVALLIGGACYIGHLNTEARRAENIREIVAAREAYDAAKRRADLAAALAAAEAQRQAADAEAARQAAADRRAYDAETARMAEAWRGVPVPRSGDSYSWRPPRPGGGSTYRPVRPYFTTPGDPNDRDHDLRACESGCKN